MKKIFLVMALMGLLPFLSFSQKEGSSGYINLNLGLGIPAGDFADVSYLNHSSGYAQVGPSFNFTFAMPIARSWFGFAAQIGYYNNAVDDASFNRSLLLANIPARISTIGQYEEATIAAGLFVTIPVHKVAIDFKIMAGGAYCVLPEVDFSDGNYISSDNSFSAMVTGDVGFRYRFSRIMCATANVGFMYADPSFLPNSSGGLQNVTQPISIVNASLGIGFNIR